MEGNIASLLADKATQNGIPLPGTTIPKQHNYPSETPAASSPHQAHSFPGPTIGERQTITALYEPSQLAVSPVIPALHRLINDAFDHSHTTKGIPINILRLPTIADYIREIGTDPGTFVYVISFADSGEPVACAGAHRYVATVTMAESNGDDHRAFTRAKMPAMVEAGGRGAEETWELKLMAVDIKFGGKGLASYLMKLVDEEILRRVRALREQTKIWMVLTTCKEANHEYYLKRGYVDDYETAHEPGFMGAPNGFHIVHMSRCLT